MDSRMLRIFAIAAGLSLSSQALAQPDPADAWINSVPAEAAAADLSDAYEAAIAEHLNSQTYEGVGGPIEERTGYPPCTPNPVDDNCIQLYERGVTGLGN